jgi:methylated-DNA-[protein]-cysteine S-methyltransferase
MNTRWYRHTPSPIGPLVLVGDDRGLGCIYLEGYRGITVQKGEWVRDDSRFADAVEQLDEYFAGNRRTFDLQLRPEGTPFQHLVWNELRKIPFGETASYGEIAARIGRPGAARAVGAANGRNPLPIVVPCHRVIGADGSLTGFGGGIENKAWLLDHERAAVHAVLPLGQMAVAQA